MWSVGCIFAELLRGVPLFSAKDEIALLIQICAVLGHPPESIIPKGFTLPPESKNPRLRNLFPREQAIQTQGFYLSNTGMDLLRSFLHWDPKIRIDADGALRHAYFEEAPKPRQVEFMPTFAATNDGREVRSGGLDAGVFQ